MGSRGKRKREARGAQGTRVTRTAQGARSEHFLMETMKGLEAERNLIQVDADRVDREQRELEARMAAVRKIVDDGAAGFMGLVASRDEKFLRSKERMDRALGEIQRNGITIRDLEAARETGRQEGFKEAGLSVVKCCYAGIILALHEEFGFGEDECFRAISRVDEKIIYALNHSEMVDEVLDKTGLILDMDDPFDRVQRTEEQAE